MFPFRDVATDGAGMLAVFWRYAGKSADVHEQGLALAHADTGGDEAGAATTTLQFTHAIEDQPGRRGAERMAVRDRAAVHGTGA